MRRQLLALSLSAAVAAALAPGLMHAQTREPCIGRVVDCVRRDAIERRLDRQRTLVVDREVRSEARAERLADARGARRWAAEARADARRLVNSESRLRARIREDRSRERAMDRADRARERRGRARVDRRLRIRYRDE
jgi:hypothetical protein